PITSLLYLITTIFNLSFLFYQQPFLLLLLPLYSINILALTKNTIFGFQLDKSSKEKLAYYTIFITFLAFYFLYFVASKPKIILAQSGGCSWSASSSSECGPSSSGVICCYGCTYYPSLSMCACSYTDTDKPSCEPFVDPFNSLICHYDGSAVCTSSGWKCSYSSDGNKPTCSDYCEFSTLDGVYIYHHDGSPSCGDDGWTCVYSHTFCGFGEGCCSGVGCVDLSSDPDNCGSCGNSCDDGNVCTDDSCVSGSCQHTPKPDGTVIDGGVCCDGNWIEGGECCSDADCASKSCDNGVNPVCDTTGTYGNPYTCACPKCKSSDECANPTDCCAYEVDPSRGDCVPEGTIIGNYLCDRPEWVLESSLLFKLTNNNPFSIAE
ncbi:MAG: hypothetical protein J7K83_01385, partial [Candidatus Aenigmarchaeota archaeon]|nr:hypothetical protein [Candidatus Aenigmarchaeota archaeon]